MNRVAIVTLYDENNYGNRLQNYAVQRCLERVGCKAETVVSVKLNNGRHTLKYYIASVLWKISPKIVSLIKLHFSRLKNFERFTKKNVKTRYIVTANGCLPCEIECEYDFFIAGSDQIWNPSWGNYENRYSNMFLLFAPFEKRLCFSPSFGVSEIPEEWLESFKDGLNGFNELNVRELSGADIIKKLTGRNAQVLIDPTLMLNADEWLKIAKKIKIPRRPYVFEYFLGERDDNELNRVAKDNNLHRLTLLDETNHDIYVSNPGQFIYMISRADLVCTDSFHACVFSIIFGKPFIVYRRKDKTKDMYDRIDTLLKMFDADSNREPIIVSPEVRDRVLKKEREKVVAYLKRNLKL